MFLSETISVLDTKARNEEKKIFYPGILNGILKYAWSFNDLDTTCIRVIEQIEKLHYDVWICQEEIRFWHIMSLFIKSDVDLHLLTNVYLY